MQSVLKDTIVFKRLTFDVYRLMDLNIVSKNLKDSNFYSLN